MSAARTPRSASEGSFAHLFDEKVVRVGVGATVRDQALGELVDVLVKSGRLAEAQRAGLLKALIQREGLGSTGIGGGIALPHVKLEGVEEVVAAAMVTSARIDFNTIDGEGCDVFFLLVSPKSRAEAHLSILRWLSKLVRDEDFPRFMRGSRSPAEIVGLIQEMGG